MDTAPRKLVATQGESGDVDLPECETGSEEDVTGRPVACKAAAGKPCASSKSDCQGSPKAEKKKKVTQSTRVSSPSSPHGSSLLDRQENLRTRTWWPFGWSGREHGYFGHISECHSSSRSSSWTRLWGEFTIREGSYLGKCGTVIQRSWETDQWTKNTAVSTINFKELTWMSTSLLCSRAYQSTKTKTYVFSDSDLSVGKWEMILLQLESKIKWYSENNSRTWIESMVCRRSSSAKYSQESQR